VFTRTVRHDAPFGWRVVAHGTVLLLTLSVLAFAHAGRSGTASAGLIGLRGGLEWDADEGDPAALLLAQPVPAGRGGAPVGAEAAPEGDPAAEPPAAMPAADGDMGFLSPGPIPEADPSLLPWEEPQTYVVQGGDTLGGIAGHFGIDVEALLFANPNLVQKPYLQPGDVLTILPINGVLHVVVDGDTLESIAAKYKVEHTDIIEYAPNNVAAGSALVAGTQIVVPGGMMEIAIPSYSQMVNGSSASGRRAAETWNSGGGPLPGVGSGQFYIAANGRVTQGYKRYHGGIDIANRTGTPIYAIDGGTVVLAGWWSWAGNAVKIDHGNGYVSLYAHMSRVDVHAGQPVQRGQIIGGIGCTRGSGGRCTGPHLHLEVYYGGGRVNPCRLGVCP
jgi:murein DD-endopeptidase MepM/ murein hydrolase activator NlpD